MFLSYQSTYHKKEDKLSEDLEHIKQLIITLPFPAKAKNSRFEGRPPNYLKCHYIYIISNASLMKPLLETCHEINI